MNTLYNYSEVQLESLVTHHVGNKLREENLILANEQAALEQDSLEFVLKYFLQSFKAEDFYRFTHSVEREMNDIYAIAKLMFENKKMFIENSQSIAKLLYESSVHPKVKEGELSVAYFNNFYLDNEAMEVIGIFKSENSSPFIKIKNTEEEGFLINHEYGFELKGIDKGCLIFNTNQEDGFKILIVDTKSADAQYWRNDFLKVEPLQNEFFQTSEFLGLTKEFVIKRIPEEFEVSKAEQIDILNRSVDYFKKNETFDKEEFETQVFQQEAIIRSFRSFDEDYQQTNDIEIPDSFEISQQAVKKKEKVLKTVLKLDKNFHIYIHGDRQLIEQGVEEDGRKFYKIYYDRES